MKACSYADLNGHLFLRFLSMAFVVPRVYMIIHVALGFLAFLCAPLTICLAFLAYQLTQYALGVRFFFLSSECLEELTNCDRPGNDARHTLNKILQFATGWLAGWFVSRCAAG